MKVPFLVRLQCRKCGLKKYRFCTAYGGIQPPVWTRTLRFITTCGTFKHEKDFMQWSSYKSSTGEPCFPEAIDLRLEMARRRPRPQPSCRHFKPRTAWEKRLWKNKAKPED